MAKLGQTFRMSHDGFDVPLLWTVERRHIANLYVLEVIPESVPRAGFAAQPANAVGTQIVLPLADIDAAITLAAAA